MKQSMKFGLLAVLALSLSLPGSARISSSSSSSRSSSSGYSSGYSRSYSRPSSSSGSSWFSRPSAPSYSAPTIVSRPYNSPVVSAPAPRVYTDSSSTIVSAPAPSVMSRPADIGTVRQRPSIVSRTAPLVVAGGAGAIVANQNRPSRVNRNLRPIIIGNRRPQTTVRYINGYEYRAVYRDNSWQWLPLYMMASQPQNNYYNQPIQYDQPYQQPYQRRGPNWLTIGLGLVSVSTCLPIILGFLGFKKLFGGD